MNREQQIRKTQERARHYFGTPAPAAPPIGAPRDDRAPRHEPMTESVRITLVGLVIDRLVHLRGMDQRPLVVDELGALMEAGQWLQGDGESEQ